MQLAGPPECSHSAWRVKVSSLHFTSGEGKGEVAVTRGPEPSALAQLQSLLPWGPSIPDAKLPTGWDAHQRRPQRPSARRKAGPAESGVGALPHHAIADRPLASPIRFLLHTKRGPGTPASVVLGTQQSLPLLSGCK